MNLLDRYIFKSILVTCLGAVGLFAFVLTVGNVMKELMGYLLADQIDTLLFLRLTGLLILYTASFALPMGVLTGVLLTLGRLSADSEITAMRSSGISLARIARPVLILGALLSLLTLWVNEQAAPQARAAFKRELAEAVRSNPMSMLVPRTFIRQFPGLVLYVGERQGNTLADFWLWQLDGEQRAVRLVRARHGEIGYVEADNALVLTLRDAIVEVRDPKKPEQLSEPQWVGSIGETEPFRLPLDRLFSRSQVRTRLDYLPRAELSRRLSELELPPPGETREKRAEREKNRAKVLLVMSERVNNAIAVFSFALIAVPLGIRVSRRETSANLGIAVALALSYFFFSTCIGWLEKVPGTEPWLLLCIPNAAMMITALWLHARVEQR